MPLDIGTAVIITDPLAHKVGIIMDVLPGDRYIVGRYFRYPPEMDMTKVGKKSSLTLSSPESDIRDRLILLSVDRQRLNPIGIKRKPVI